MKIIFFDFDGVVNVNYAGERDEFGQAFHPNFVENLKTIIDQTGAKIVISSSWRKNGLSKMKAMWKHRNLPGEVIDTTCSLYLKRDNCIRFYNNKLNEHPTPKINGYSIPRGCEIDYWLREKGYYDCSWSREEQLRIIERSGIESYVIIDDDSDMLLSQKRNFVRTSGNTDHLDHVEGFGLTVECALKAIAILNNNVMKYAKQIMHINATPGFLANKEGMELLLKMAENAYYNVKK